MSQRLMNSGNNPRLLKRVGILLLSVWGMAQMAAQVPVAQMGFQAEGPVPEDFLMTVESAYKQQLGRHTDFSEEQADFYLQNAYQVHQLLRSGKVLFNDDATRYLNLVADQILKHRPELRNSLRFYAVKNPEVNAFATNDGLVLVNIGLLAHLKQESQLAFILCHEISHYLHQHPLDIYLKGQESAGGPDPGNADGEGLFSTRYTREKELEADRLGWELYLEAGYDPEAALAAFDLVQQAGKPFGDARFDMDWLRISSVSIPDLYLLQELEDNPPLQSGRQSTHPNAERRRDLIREFIDVQNPGPGIVGSLDFVDLDALRTRCRFEVVRMQLMQRRYERALYHAWLLYRDFPNDAEVLRFRAYALYALATYANAGRLWDVHEDYQLVPGEQQRVNYLMEMCAPRELTALALHHTWNLHRLFPEDEALRLMSRDLMEVLSNQYLETLDTPDSVVQSDQAIFFPAMLEMMQDSVFAADIGKIMIRNRQFQDLAHTPMMRPAAGSAVVPDLELVGLKLGLDQVVWVDPYYQVIRYQDKQPLALMESEEKELTFTNLITEYGADLSMQQDMLSHHHLEANDAGSFNDLAALQAWVQERGLHQDISLVSWAHNDIKLLGDKYGTPYFVWVGCMAQQERRKGKGVIMTAGILLPPLLPYAVWYLVSPRHRTLLYCMVYNVNTGTYEVIYPHVIDMKDREDVIRSATYDLLLQIQGK